MLKKRFSQWSHKWFLTQQTPRRGSLLNNNNTFSNNSFKLDFQWHFGSGVLMGSFSSEWLRLNRDSNRYRSRLRWVKSDWAGSFFPAVSEWILAKYLSASNTWAGASFLSGEDVFQRGKQRLNREVWGKWRTNGARCRFSLNDATGTCHSSSH